MVGSADTRTALMWRKYSVFSWCSVYSILLHFFLVLTGKKTVLNRWWFYLLLYMPPVFLIYGYLVTPGMTIDNLVLTNLGWTYISPYSKGISLSHFFDVYYSAYMVTGLVVTWQWGRKSVHTREKKQARLIVSTIIAALLLGSVTDVIMPNLGMAPIPQIAIVIILIPIYGIWYSIKGYRLMSITPESAAKDILKTMKDGLLLVGTDGRIQLANQEAQVLLGYNKDELVGRPAQIIFPEDRDFFGFASRDYNDNNVVWHKEEILLSKMKERIPTLFSTSIMHDDWGEIIGLVCTFQDITKRKQAEDALKKAYDELEQRVHERTLELLETNESLKTEIIERENMQKKVRYYAYHDYLTGLPNKLLFKERLNQAILQAARTEKILAVLFLDLDAFKTINDTMGYGMGDELLKDISKRLTGVLRKSDTVARIGGDEFVIMLQNLPDVNSVTKVADKIIRQFNRPFNLAGQDCYSTASIGIALYPTDGEDMEMLLKNADIALYKAKEVGRNKYKFCSSLMKSQAVEIMKLTNNLYRALENDELFLCYQPQVSSISGRIIGVEALLRWRHPEMGLVMPELFIPIAEKTGLIMPIGEWVLRTACRQNKAWQNAGLPNIRMAVNLSMYEVQNPGRADRITSILSETGLDPGYLELEITESAAMKEAEHIIKTLHSFKELGVTISIDDFGIEFSSLNYLKQLPVDRIKIAMSFVRGICESAKDEAIIKAIIVLANNLGLNVIAEGVETRQQLAFLTQHMCDEIQGYYYHKPMPANELELLMKKNENVC
jgi:diguanylate cyclase (GGDEF)-like protein/PAS domain S-box-containing protein